MEPLDQIASMAIQDIWLISANLLSPYFIPEVKRGEKVTITDITIANALSKNFEVTYNYEGVKTIKPISTEWFLEMLKVEYPSMYVLLGSMPDNNTSEQSVSDDIAGGVLYPSGNK